MTDTLTTAALSNSITSRSSLVRNAGISVDTAASINGSQAEPPVVISGTNGTNITCPAFVPLSYPPVSVVEYKPAQTCRDSYVTSEPVYSLYVDRCLGAYCNYALNSLYSSYYYHESSKPLTTSSREIPVAIYGSGSLSTKIVSHWTETRIVTCRLPDPYEILVGSIELMFRRSPNATICSFSNGTML